MSTVYTQRGERVEENNEFSIEENMFQNPLEERFIF